MMKIRRGLDAVRTERWTVSSISQNREGNSRKRGDRGRLQFGGAVGKRRVKVVPWPGVV